MQNHDEPLINTNRIQTVDSTQISSQTRRRFDAKFKTFTNLTIKHCLIVFALGTVIAYNSKATVISFPPDPVGRDLKISHPGMRVRVEKWSRKVNVDSNGVILKGYDPVAYFTQKKAVKGSPKYQTTYQGATYYFSSAADLAIFRKNPSKYATQYGGFCANGVKNNRLVDADPTVFFIVKGKLYVCASPADAKEFRAHEHEDIITANRNWYQLIH